VEGSQCSGCHEAPGDQHYGDDCAACHTTDGFSGASLPAHEPPLVGMHQQAPCSGCHEGSQDVPEYECSNCHARPEGHLSGECTMCHSESGWASSIAYVVELSPQVSHTFEGREACFTCHEVGGEIRPAPSNHVDYEEAQCGLCHKPE
jgi:hypothetical protein